MEQLYNTDLLKEHLAGYARDWYKQAGERCQNKAKIAYNADLESGMITNRSRAPIAPGHNTRWLLDNYLPAIREYAYNSLWDAWINGNRETVREKIMRNFEKPILVDFLQWVDRNCALNVEKTQQLYTWLKRFNE